MTDIIDAASDRAERELERAIAAARATASKDAVQPEFCLNDCGEIPREGSRYCSADCRDDHSDRQARRRRQGLK